MREDADEGGAVKGKGRINGQNDVAGIGNLLWRRQESLSLREFLRGEDSTWDPVNQKLRSAAAFFRALLEQLVSHHFLSF